MNRDVTAPRHRKARPFLHLGRAFAAVIKCLLSCDIDDFLTDRLSRLACFLANQVIRPLLEMLDSNIQLATSMVPGLFHHYVGLAAAR